MQSRTTNVSYSMEMRVYDQLHGKQRRVSAEMRQKVQSETTISWRTARIKRQLAFPVAGCVRQWAWRGRRYCAIP